MNEIISELQSINNKLFDKYGLDDEILKIQMLINEYVFSKDIHGDEFVQ